MSATDSLEITLSIVIVSWNTCQLLQRCLRSIEDEIAGWPQWHVETFVVDNASTDDTVQMVREEFPWVKLLVNEANAGFAAANNQAIHLCNGRFILLLNSDTEIHPGALEILLAFMEAHPKAGAAGARLLNGDGSLQPSCQPMLTPEREFWRLSFLDELWPRATYRMERWDRWAPRRVEVIKGACLLLRRQALDEIGLLDDRYFMYTEEVDLCYRLMEAGWQLWYVPAARVTHYGERSSRQVAEAMYVQLYRSKVQFYRKTGGEKRARRFKAFVALAYWPRLAIAALRARRGAEWQARAHTYRRLMDELPEM